MATDEYLELVENAREALYTLLRETEPGTGMPLHHAYRELTVVLRGCEKTQLDEEEQQRRHKEWEERRRRREAWTAMPMAQREQIVLHLLGDRRLTIRELFASIDKAHSQTCDIYESDIRSLVNRLYRARELDRESELVRPGGKAIRYRYYARRRLEGPIVDLERAFKSPSDSSSGME